MASKRNHSGNTAIENYKSHSLDNFCPPLRKYLRDGIDVLDIGCGPGSVTVNVAEAIGSGMVTGIDPEDKSLGMARERRRFRHPHRVSRLPGVDENYARLDGIQQEIRG